jgi:hypothetical protein
MIAPAKNNSVPTRTVYREYALIDMEVLRRGD